MTNSEKQARKKSAVCASLGIILSMLVLPAANTRYVNNQYARWHLGQPYGYTDKVVGPNRWHIKGLGMHTHPGFMDAMVLHRAAILAKASGFDHFDAVSFKSTCMSLFVRSKDGRAYHEGPGVCEDQSIRDQEMHITVVGTHSDAFQSGCIEKGTWAQNCRSYDVTEVLEMSKNFLGLSAEQEDAELLEAKRALSQD